MLKVLGPIQSNNVTKKTKQKRTLLILQDSL